MNFLEMLHEDLNKGEKPWKIKNQQMTYELFWRNYSQENNSIVKRLFAGVVENRYLCRQCQTNNLNWDAFMSLPL